MTWDTEGLYREACDHFTSVSTQADDQRKLLVEIARIKSVLLKMEELNEVRVSSCNDSSWNPGLTTDEVKAFVTQKLHRRREELRRQFNNYGVKLKEEGNDR